MGVAIEFSIVGLICIPTHWEDPKLVNLRKHDIFNQATDGTFSVGLLFCRHQIFRTINWQFFEISSIEPPDS